MASNKQPSAVPIQAHLSGIEIVGDLNKKSNARPDHFVLVYVDDEEAAKSEKKPSVPAPRWEWKEGHRLLFQPSSTIKIVIYREGRAHISKHVIGQYSGKFVEVLDNNTIIDFMDKTGTGTACQAKIDLSLVSGSDDFEALMETVRANVSRLDGTVRASSGISTLGAALKLTKNIMDIVADAHPVLKASWTIMSAVYEAVQEAEILDDTVRDLAENLREMLGAAKECPDLLLITGTTNVIEEIGRTSLKVTSLIHEYTKPSFTRRTLNSQLSDDMKIRIVQCHKSCDDLKQKFDRRVAIATNQQGNRTATSVSEIKVTLMEIKDDQRAGVIRQWLSAPDSSSNYNEAREQHQKETCSWFLNGTRFRELQEKADFLWIKGTAGCGKTVLCSSIIDKIMELRKEDESVSYAYFFFDGRDSQKDLQLHDKLIRSLISQLFTQCDSIPAVLVELYDRGQQPSTGALQDALDHILNGLQSTYIIIDSLDECVDREKVLLWINQIISRRMGNLRMVVASRPEPDIGDVLQPLDLRSVDLATESVNNDITMYLDQQLSQVKKWDDDTRNIVKSTLLTRAQGMFRWVTLQLMELKKCSNRRSVMTQLDSLPKGLYETYNQILSKVDEETDRTETITFLRWLCFSVRPMTLAEIAETVVVDFDAGDEPRCTSAHRYWDKKDVLVKCSGLITESDGKVKLAHFSIKEYLLSEHLRTGNISAFHLGSDKLSHSLISQSCLAYLLQFDSINSLVGKNVSVSFPLALYAAKHWIFHAQSGGIDQSESSLTLTLAQKLFLPKSATFANWIDIWDLDQQHHRQSDNRITIVPPLYYASLAGLQRVSEYLLAKVGTDVNAPGGGCGNALQAAAAGGEEEIVKLLLKKGASVNAQGGQYGTALQAASAGGHEATVKLLLEKEAGVNAQGGQYGTALHAASSRGYGAIAELLLEKGADPNVQAGKYGTPLQAASSRGYEAIVKLLLEKGVDVNARGGEYGSALQVALSRGYEAVAKLLLEKGADPNAQGGEYGNALQAAAVVGGEAIIELLLEKGADVNARGGEYGNALQAASYWGREVIAKLLLDKGADINAQGGEYGTALQAASVVGGEAIAKLLLEKGADVNAEGGEYGNALQAASSRGYEAVAKLLLEKGADPNGQGGKYSTALNAASAKGYVTIVKLLLENGADASSLS